MSAVDEYEKWLAQRIGGLMKMSRDAAAQCRFDRAAGYDAKRRTLIEARDALTRLKHEEGSTCPKP
jgi:hypothetical protein